MPIIQTTKPLRPRADFEHYPTPIELCRKALSLLERFELGEKTLGSWTWNQTAKLNILDVGAGTGVWGEAARERWPKAIITGIEIQRHFAGPACYDRWLYGDFLSYHGLSRERFDLIIGNPPYGDAWEEEQRRRKKKAKIEGTEYEKPPRPTDLPVADAEACVRRALSLCWPSGQLLFLLRLAFLEGQARSAGLWAERKPTDVHVLSRRPSFTGNGKTDATAYAIYIWQASSKPQKVMLDWLRW